ncbi:MAG: winged helix-turn-helix domain-containing protein [Candidatus Woesearchaeota archaeon]
MAKKRTKIEIIHDMLQAILSKGKIKPTHVMYKANLSHNLLKGYLEELLEKEMIKEVEERNYTYLVITDKGVEFLNEFRKMKDFQETFGL